MTSLPTTRKGFCGVLGLTGVAAFTTACGGPSVAVAVPPPRSAFEYRVYVANESSDVVSRVVFDEARGAQVEREIPVGIMPADTDGPHGLAISPDGEFLYLTLAHGTPDGELWKIRTGEDVLVGRTTLSRFPATLSTSPDGQLLFVANFNLHGDPVPSDVSIVFAPDLRELARIQTCVTPHGSRMSASGRLHYSACGRSDQVVEIDLSSYAISKRFSLRPGGEGLLGLDDTGAQSSAGSGGSTCAPTWVTPAAGVGEDRFVYVTCNAAGEVVELDVRNGTVSRRFAAGAGPYNMELTPGGAHLLVTLRSGQAVIVIDLGSGERVAEIPTTQPFTHGVVVSPDGHYAFVSNEAIGSIRGTLDVIDLSSYQRVASVELQHQPGGIAFWRTDRVGEGPTVSTGN